jgi:hypothetical protein
VLRLTAVLALGMSPYLYLPLSAYLKGVDSWGDQRTVRSLCPTPLAQHRARELTRVWGGVHMGLCVQWEGFIHHFLRREYGTFQLAADQTDDPGMIARLIVYWQVRFAVFRACFMAELHRMSS